MTRLKTVLIALATRGRTGRFWSLALVALPIVLAACNRSNGGGPGY